MHSSEVPPNFIVDQLVFAAPFEAVEAVKEVAGGVASFESAAFKQWVAARIPGWESLFKDLGHKKLLEFYVTCMLLQPESHHVFMDAAGGVDSYLPGLACGRRILQDIYLAPSVREKLGPEMEYLECDAGDLPLPDNSVDCISCHHSFEHFRGDTDVRFIREAQRVLRPGGRLCIVPIFLANVYAEITDAATFDLHTDPAARYVIDPTAAIPGGVHCGNYAKVYDVRAFTERIVGSVDMSRFSLSVLEIRMDGELTPDMSLDCHRMVTAVNRPYRALLMERSA